MVSAEPPRHDPCTPAPSGLKSLNGGPHGCRGRVVVITPLQAQGDGHVRAQVLPQGLGHLFEVLRLEQDLGRGVKPDPGWGKGRWLVSGLGSGVGCFCARVTCSDQVPVWSSPATHGQTKPESTALCPGCLMLPPNP